jgi:hypothetical protein
MEKQIVVAVAAALVSMAGVLHPEPARADEADASAHQDSTVDASLDPGEERISAEADNKARLADLRYAYFIGYNARAREDSKSYSNLGDEVKHRQMQPGAPATPSSVSSPSSPASSKQVAERAAPTRPTVAQVASPRHVSAPVASVAQVAPARQVVAPVKQAAAPVPAPKRLAAARPVPAPTPARQVVAHAEPAPLSAPLRHAAEQVASVPQKHVPAPPASFKQASVQVPPPKRVELPPLPEKHVTVAARTTPPKFAGESEPPILIPTQAVTSLPNDNADDAADAKVAQRHEAQGARRAAPQNRQDDEDSQYATEQVNDSAPAAQAAPNRQVRQYQNPQYATAPAYNQGATESQDSGGYGRRQYVPPPPPPPPRTVQANQYYAPAQYPPARYQQADAQSAYVPRPPVQAAAQQVVVVARPPAYQTYDSEMYTPPELRRHAPANYTNPAQQPGYQGWE